MAVIMYDGWTWSAVHMHSWIATKGTVSREFLREAARYPFSTGRKVLIGITPGNNAPALKFNSHYGFKETHRITDGCAPGVDMVIQEMRPDDCRWLRGVKHGRSKSKLPQSHGDDAGSRGLGDVAAVAAASPGSSSGAGESQPDATGDDKRREPAASSDGRPQHSGPPESWHPDSRRSRAVRSTAATSPASGTAECAASAEVGSTSAQRCGGTTATPSVANVARRWYSSAVADGVSDEDVSEEPICDIEAQLEDLHRPGSKRLAVYLSPRNVKAHQWAIQEPYMVMPDGGIMLFRNWPDCHVVERRLNDGVPLRQVIGESVLAGVGKPYYTDNHCVAQLRNTADSVARESLQPSKSAALAKIAEWLIDAPELTPVVIATHETLQRRAALVASQTSPAEPVYE